MSLEREDGPTKGARRGVAAEFVTSAAQPFQYPPAQKPEIAFAGRSNVGKSSLINALVNRKRLVKTSRTPGRTQLINFFDVDRNLTFVDLPGYGYAKVPPEIKKKWGPMVTTYLSSRDTLKGVAVLMDIRRTPGAEERSFIAWLRHYRRPALLVLTKADKLTRSRQLQQRRVVAEALAVPPEALIRFSAKTRQGKAELWQAIDNLLR
jgi:GTP-binding protein